MFKLNFRPYIRRYTSPNENFEYSYPLILFQELIDFNQHLLQMLGVSHTSIDRICEITAKHNFHTKLTGAGGGGCCITLLRPGNCSFK